MTSELKTHTLRFNRALEPFKVMLVNRRAELSSQDWFHLVNRTKEGILNQPDQYLGKELPDAETLSIAIDKIFSDFLKVQKVEQPQSPGTKSGLDLRSGPL
jgi:hypothetical protein